MSKLKGRDGRIPDRLPMEDQQ